MTEGDVSNLDNILINGAELILNRVFDRIQYGKDRNNHQCLYATEQETSHQYHTHEEA